MTRRWWWLFALVLALPRLAEAHVGSPDVFYDGMVGPYPARITVRVPQVIPGRAEISVHVDAAQPVEVSFLPLFSNVAVSNAPPPDLGVPIRGETNYYAGDLWLMSFGAYSIEIKIHGPAGEGSVEIPVNSNALKQLPLPSYLGEILVLLTALLICGGIAIAAGAARDASLEPGAIPGERERRKGRWAAGISVAIFVFVLALGNAWWKSDEKEFRRHLRGGGWSDLKGTVRADGPQRILDLTIGKKTYGPDESLSLLPDHGKLLHFFLIREGEENAFAHIHPVRTSGKTFSVALPPLPAGRYKMLCDLTFEDSGISRTATNSVELPPVPETSAQKISLEPDPDDSWAVYPVGSVASGNSTNSVYTLPDGGRVVWRPHGPLRARHDAGLQFDVVDAAGNPAELEPYMGMMCHAAVLRRDGEVFAHLHPSGNFSMAAQGFFQAKMARETGGDASDPMAGMDHSKMHHGMHHPAANGAAMISLPYEFPSAGDYRLWVQFKTGGKVSTAVFDATVAEAAN